MQNIIRRGNTWYARLFIHKDRWADVGKALGAPSGIKREVVRTLQTTDIREARRRLQPALSAMTADVEAALKAAGKAPLTDWTADWRGRAMELRKEVSEASSKPEFGAFYDSDGVRVAETSQRDLVLEGAEGQTEHVAEVAGREAAREFAAIVTSGAKCTIQEALDLWLKEIDGTRRDKTVAGHRKVFSDLDRWLKEHHTRSLLTMTFTDFTRRMAGEFIAWRRGQVSAAAVKREFSAPMGLWRWAIRRGHAEINPWADQTAGMEVTGQTNEEDAKRAFTTPELVQLIRAQGITWAPNGGGYAATLWDAVRLGLLTGLRAAESADLKIQDITEDGSVIRVIGGKTRNARRRVPLPQLAQRVISLRLAELPNTSPEAPLWPELPILKLTKSRGGKLSDRFRIARDTILPGVEGVDFHSIRRSYATALEAAMNAGGRINPAIIASLMGHARGTLALDGYSMGATMEVLKTAVKDFEEKGFPADVQKALADTMGDRPKMVRFAPAVRGRGLLTAEV